MTPKERVYAALHHQETDIVPYIAFVTEKAAAQLTAYYGHEEFKQWVVDHVAWTELVIPNEIIDEHHYRDAWGCAWERGNIFHLTDHPLKDPTLTGYAFPDFTKPEYYADIPAFLSANHDRYTFYNLGMFFFERAWALRGFENILMDMALNPSFVGELLDRLMHIQIDIIDQVKNYPFDAIRFGDDYGQQKGLIMGPTLWRQLLKPRLQRLYDHAHSRGFDVYLHSCGDNSEIMDDLIDMGVDIFNPLQPEAMDVLEMKRRYGQRITFEGGISAQQTLPFGTPDDVRREVTFCLKNLGAGGGYIAAPAKFILEYFPVENAAALIETLAQQQTN